MLPTDKTVEATSTDMAPRMRLTLVFSRTSFWSKCSALVAYRADRDKIGDLST